MFYQWNRKVGWAATGDVTGWDSSTSSGTTWGKANDPSPAGFRVPTLDEMKSLTNPIFVKYEWTNSNGVWGGKFTDFLSGQSIFLPAAGRRNGYSSDSALFGVGSSGSYWSSTQYLNDVSRAYDLSFYSSAASWGNGDIKSYGFSVRPVAE